MKWILITTIGKNPGDEFIRIGVEKIICEVDGNPEFVLIDKEDEQQWKKKIDFDFAVWCGMPLFWSLKTNSCWKINWWRFLNGWISENKEKFAVVGAGDFCPWGNEDLTITDISRLSLEAKRVIDRSSFVYARSDIVSKVTRQNIQSMVCPAAFSIFGIKNENKYDLCNLMPNGAHYREFGADEAKAWDKIKYDLATVLKSKGFIFVAHRDDEVLFAKDLGWKDSEIIRYNKYNRKCTEVLEYYGNCRRFIGNRIHGAITSRACGGDVICIGYDSRQEAVILSGGKSFKPSTLDLNYVSEWMDKKGQVQSIENITKDFNSYVKSFKAMVGE